MDWFEEKDRICAQCCLGEVENVEQFILRCGKLMREREREVLVSQMEEIVDGFEGRHDEEVMLVLSEVCIDGRAGRAIERNVGEKILCSRLIKIKLTDVPGSSSDFT